MSDNKPAPLLLLILDGWGHAPKGPGNAVSQARTPNLDWIEKRYPGSILKCFGPHVGLPQGQMGNSEVGHLNMGAGRIVYQDIMRINLAIENSDLSRNPNLNRLLENIRPKGRLHLMGLVSDGGVHSLQNHLHSLAKMARDKEVEDIFVHCFLDGRDTSPVSGAGFVAELQDYLAKIRAGRIVSVSGRYYAMDRDKRWERTMAAYDALTLGEGSKSLDPVHCIKQAYAQGVTDEFVPPQVMVNEAGEPLGILEDGDGVIFFNFRADRARQLTRALHDPDFNSFQRRKKPELKIVTMTSYDKDFGLPVLFPPEKMDNILGQVISRNSLTQLRIAETEKYAHVTYFFNGGEEEPFPGEKRILVPSPREVPTYDLKPEMSVYGVTDTLVQKINDRSFDVYICNFANLDMVGHSGSVPATIKACEAVDQCVGRAVEAMLHCNGAVILTSDHGNAEDMLDESGKVKTAHSLNPVPIRLISDQGLINLRREGILADIAPTMLHLLGLEKPREMTGESLISGWTLERKELRQG